MPILGPNGQAIRAEDPFINAVIKMIQEVGGIAFQIRTEQSQIPPIFVSMASFGRPGGTNIWDCAAGRTPQEAVKRLVSTVINKSTCTACQRPTVFDENITLEVGERVFMGDAPVCLIYYDPDKQEITRECSEIPRDVVDTQPS